MTLTVGPPAPSPTPEPAPAGRGTGRHRAPKARTFRRAKTLAGALGITLMSAALPGSGYLWSRRRLGYVVLIPFLVGIGAAAYYAADLHRAVDFAFDPTRLHIAMVAIGAVLLVWVFVVATTYLMVRPPGMSML